LDLVNLLTCISKELAPRAEDPENTMEGHNAPSVLEKEEWEPLVLVTPSQKMFTSKTRAQCAREVVM